MRMTGIVERFSGSPQIVGTREPDEAVPQIFPLKQKEDQKNHHDGGGCQRLEKRPEHPLGNLHRRQVRLMDFGGSRGLWLSGTWRQPRRLRPVVGRFVGWRRRHIARPLWRPVRRDRL